MRLAVFTDFDGTITTRDANDALVDSRLGPHRRLAFDRMFACGEVDLWRVLDASLQACRIPLDEAIALLVSRITLDPAFPAFSRFCAERRIPLTVISAGVFEVVQAFLAHAGLDLPIQANRAAMYPDRFGLIPLEAGCPTGVDKARAVREARAAGYTVAFVGDGLSDQLAAPEADWVYAKSGLARFMTGRGLKFSPYETFGDVQADLEVRLALESRP